MNEERGASVDEVLIGPSWRAVRLWTESGMVERWGSGDWEVRGERCGGEERCTTGERGTLDDWAVYGERSSGEE